MDNFEDAEEVDLGALLGATSRQGLEVIIVRLLGKYPEEFDMIRKSCADAFDLGAIEVFVATCTESKDIVEASESLDEVLEQAMEFIKSGSGQNASAILHSLTGPVVGCCSQDSFPEKESEQFSLVEQFFSRLELAWSSLFAMKTSSITSAENPQAELEERFKELAEYRTQLTNLMGPLFSDPLRTLKRKIKAGDSDVKRKLGGAVDSSEAKKQKQ